ncbi:MAG: T9SS type A sorting domain-containing protein [Cryomorphaceae bacterium]|nr:T9SS type A sorting domain-containing protein [Cryomorphaceae bacterium]
MKNKIIILIVAQLLSVCVNAQQVPKTFLEHYQGLFLNDIVDLKDSTYMILVRRNILIENRGVRIVILNSFGDIIDSMSVEDPIIDGGLRNETFSFINDTTFITAYYSSTKPDNNTTLVKIIIKPNLDTIATKVIDAIYADTIYPWNNWQGYLMTNIMRLKNGNSLLVGSIVGQQNFNLPYFVEVDDDLNMVRDFIYYDSTYSYLVENCRELADGSFIISGQVNLYGGNNWQQTNRWRRAFIARIDSMGNKIWWRNFPSEAPEPFSRNFWVTDYPATFDLTPDSTLGMVYFQHLSCSDSLHHNSCGNGYAVDRVGRYRFMSFDLDGNLLFNKYLTHDKFRIFNHRSFTSYNLRWVPNGGGYILAANYIDDHTNHGFLYRLDKNADSIWWREPKIRLSDPFMDRYKVHVAKQTDDGGFIGVGHIISLQSLLDNFTQSASGVLVFKLDSNGCYEPGICPNSSLHVEKVFSSVAGVNIYPNPAYRVLNVELEGIRGECRIIMRNMQGQTVHEQSVENEYGSSVKTEFAVHQLASGMYIVEIHGHQGLLQTKKIIVNQ